MALYVNTNLAALEAQTNLARTQLAVGLSFQRLSSGYRINTAADDAAGLGISESLRAQVRSFTVAERNTNNAISMSQTAEGALGQIGGILTRMREIAVQSSNGDLTATDRGYLDTEYTNLKSEVDRIAQSTKFNGRDLLSGSSATVDFQVGIQNSAVDRISVVFGNVSLTTLGIASSSVGGATATAAQTAIDEIDTAIQNVSTRRADFGAVMNRLQVSVSNIQSMRTTLSAANSRIRDVDVAEETSMLARSQVLSQAGTAILAQANQVPQLALQLMRG